MEFSTRDWWKRFHGLIQFGVDSTKLEGLSKELDREKRRILLKIDKSNGKQMRMVERVKLARQQNRSSEVDLLFQELQVLKEEHQDLLKQLKILGLESLTLKRYLKCIQYLDQKKQKKVIPKILARLQNKDLSSKLLSNQVDEGDYFENLDLAFQEVGLDSDEYQASSIDSEKRSFLREIDTLIQAEQEHQKDKEELEL